jgi:hypothetical protein
LLSGTPGAASAEFGQVELVAGGCAAIRAAFDKLRLRQAFRGTIDLPHAELVEARSMSIQRIAGMTPPEPKLS